MEGLEAFLVYVLLPIVFWVGLGVIGYFIRNTPSRIEDRKYIERTETTNGYSYTGTARGVVRSTQLAGDPDGNRGYRDAYYDVPDSAGVVQSR